MKLVRQTKLGDDGNCFSACVASFLEIDIDSIPDFMDGQNWLKKINEWLMPYGYHYLECELRKEAKWMLETFGYHIMTGESPRGGVRHAVVGLNGRLYHDPHPSNCGLLEGNILYGFLIPTWLEQKEEGDE